MKYAYSKIGVVFHLDECPYADKLMLRRFRVTTSSREESIFHNLLKNQGPRKPCRRCNP